MQIFICVYLSRFLIIKGALNTWKKSASVGDLTEIGKADLAGVDDKDKPDYIANAREGYFYRNSSANIHENTHDSNLSLPTKRGANGPRRNTIAIPKYRHNYSHVKSSVNSGKRMGRADLKLLLHALYFHMSLS